MRYLHLGLFTVLAHLSVLPQPQTGEKNRYAQPKHVHSSQIYFKFISNLGTSTMLRRCPAKPAYQRSYRGRDSAQSDGGLKSRPWRMKCLLELQALSKPSSFSVRLRSAAAADLRLAE
ncbi:hypothetical protein GGS23DRAFT_561236 [Durotheca rogersii]|uniref:uncharacterized protein n=1 Tax=Durotheca rogersii TaxID=419775 RepID=UPI00221ED922|nr:uncharacterized protein GGS23DRAFT_561236 [Durotheca rogersii]KAI5864654.1 hypothetical protein GGS23DRAFT_561236 [Durotheca rogersii]